MLKKLSIICLSLMMLLLVGCSSKDKSSADLSSMSLETMMEKMYEGIKEDQLPNLMNTPVTSENVAYYLGTDQVEFAEGLASEPMIGSIPHSVVLLKMKDGSNLEETKTLIKESVDPRKWICVEVEPNNVIVENKDNIIALMMVNENLDTIQKNFKNL